MKDDIYQQIVLDRIRYYAKQSFAPDLIKADAQFSDSFARQMVFSLAADVLVEKFDEGTETVEFSYPDGWWQAFKAEHFPPMLKERFPVKYKTEKKTFQFTRRAIYPKLPLATNETGPVVFRYTVNKNKKVESGRTYEVQFGSGEITDRVEDAVQDAYETSQEVGKIEINRSGYLLLKMEIRSKFPGMITDDFDYYLGAWVVVNDKIPRDQFRVWYKFEGS